MSSVDYVTITHSMWKEFYSFSYCHIFNAIITHEHILFFFCFFANIIQSCVIFPVLKIKDPRKEYWFRPQIPRINTGQRHVAFTNQLMQCPPSVQNRLIKASLYDLFRKWHRRPSAWQMLWKIDVFHVYYFNTINLKKKNKKRKKGKCIVEESTQEHLHMKKKSF